MKGDRRMNQGIFSAKLGELDEKICRMQGRIRSGESAAHSELTDEIESIRKECEETKQILYRELKFSRAGAVSQIAEAYTEIERMIQETKMKMNDRGAETENEASFVEKKILLAEYMLDFAMQAADQALLISLEAIEAQRALQEKEERSLS